MKRNRLLREPGRPACGSEWKDAQDRRTRRPCDDTWNAPCCAWALQKHGRGLLCAWHAGAAVTEGRSVSHFQSFVHPVNTDEAFTMS